MLVAQALERPERARVLLVRLEERFVLDARVSEERDRERLRGGAELGRGPVSFERLGELLDEEMHDAVLAEEGLGHVHDRVLSSLTRTPRSRGSTCRAPRVPRRTARRRTRSAPR